MMLDLEARRANRALALSPPTDLHQRKRARRGRSMLKLFRAGARVKK